MNTAEKKQSNNGSNSTIKDGCTQSSEFKFTEEPQNSLNSSESGQQYEIVDDTPFAVVKQEDTWKIAWRSYHVSDYDFPCLTLFYGREWRVFDYLVFLSAIRRV